jgi:CheY-like chemotaxis protein/HPt (histidine-containing phosphotransfer) domain-containing protein
VTQARCAVDVLDVLRTAAMTGRPYTVAVVERSMPDVDGLKLATKIKADTAISNVQLIILTSLEDELSEELAARLELTCLRKPVRQSCWFDTFLTLAHRKQSLEVAANPGKMPPDAKSAPSLIGSTSRPQVLVADDNEINQMVAVEMLRTAGYDATVVNNGREAVSAIRRGKFDIVLMDCEMPELDGFAATRMIRTMEAEQSLATPSSRPLPIIALTAQAVRGDRERCLSAGMTDYITKPVNREELLRTIRTCLAEGAAHELRDESVSLNHVCDHGGSELTEADDAVLDFDELHERCMGDRPFMDELLQIFVRKARTNVTRISESIAAGESEDLARAAHELKGSAGNVAAVRLSEAVGLLEVAARERQDQDYAELGERVSREFASCEQMIESLLRDSGA